MPAVSFDSHGLGIIAYAQVMADGTTPGLNSGVTVTHPSTGVFEIVLPEEEDPTRTLIFLQPFIDGIIGAAMFLRYAFGVPAGTDNRTIEVLISNAAGVFSDCAFNIVVYRSVVPYEADAPI